MTRIIAIASLQMRAAVRSKLFISLTAVLVLILFGLPPTIKGDGTLLGQLRVILYYTLGFTTVILGAATLWTSSVAISQEIESRQIHLVTVKPVRPVEIWLGKWLGLLAMNAVLLCFTGLIIMGLVHWNINDTGRSDHERLVVQEELLAGRRLIRPPDTLRQEAAERYNSLLKSGAIPAGIPRDEVIPDLVKQLLSEKTVVPPLSARRWILEVPSNLRKPADGGATGIALKVRFLPVRSGDNPVSGQWNIGTGSKPAILTMATNRGLNRGLDGVYQETIPLTSALLAEVMADPGRRMIVEFRNDDKERSRTVMFDRITGIELFVREGGFESNLVRALLVVLCRLALIAALGLTASTLFSSPVATFTSSSILLLFFLTHYFVIISEMPGDDHGVAGAKESCWQAAAGKAAEKLETVFNPVMEIEAIGPLSDGVTVSWKDVGKAAFMMAVFYPGLLGAAGVLLFRRRELALPYT